MRAGGRKQAAVVGVQQVRGGLAAALGRPPSCLRGDDAGTNLMPVFMPHFL